MLLTIDFHFWEYLLYSWLLGAATAFALGGFTKQAWHRAIGIGIMSVPLWSTLIGIIESLGPLISGGTVLRAYSVPQLSSIYSRGFMSDFGHLGVGFIIFASGGRWSSFLDLKVRTLAAQLREAGLPMGRRDEGRSLAAAFLGFPVLLAAAILVNVLANQSEALTNSDETNVWANMTPYHALLIAFSAAFGEELLYRGFLQTGLSRVMPVWVAIGVQGIVFAFAHSGYGNWAHVVSPFLFAIAAGIIAVRFGIWASITLHALIDIYAFGAYAAENAPWFGGFLAFLLALNALALIVWCIVWLVYKVTRQPSPWPARTVGTETVSRPD